MSFQTENTASPPFRRGWWSRPIMGEHPERPATFMDFVARILPCLGGIITVYGIVIILYFIDIKAHSHAKFTIQSIAVDSSSSATWHVDFLVKNPSSRYSIYYDADNAEVKLDYKNAAVLNITHKHSSRDFTAFSMAFVAEDNGNDVVYEQLDIKLRGKHKSWANYVMGKEAGYFDITCQNLTRSHENKKKINCKSSFLLLKLLIADD